MRIECPKFKKPDGTECYIVIFINDSYIRNKDLFHLDTIMYRNPPKRKWISLERELSDELSYRGYTHEEKCNLKKQKMEEFVGEQALKDAMYFAWQSIKPSILKNDIRGSD